MKRVLMILAGVLALASCARMDLDEYNGSYDHRERPYKAGEEYMVSLAKQLLPDCLIALEDALIYDNYGYYTQSTSEYKTGGKSLRTEGAEWTVKSYAPMKGIKISCLGENRWKLEFQGNYTLLGYEYPTTITAQATLNNGAGSGEGTGEDSGAGSGEGSGAGSGAGAWANHNDWEVRFEGTRTERDGYVCVFTSNPTLKFFKGYNNYGWNSCTGSAFMDVTKYAKKVDRCRNEYLGNENRYFRGI
ncbi:MAG: hypothetical protein II047_00855 [Bacteroidales bacterium]|nr:hypothetical protein [Bacteroidales bacterium]